jgi:hypothetical protein
MHNVVLKLTGLEVFEREFSLFINVCPCPSNMHLTISFTEQQPFRDGFFLTFPRLRAVFPRINPTI